ncbi:uncharacterized protein MYCFIDRAFT_202510 [Pseudocercospora fijiensis CIRAD86]|uniref:N-acetyltransferase domain-containing protein n=1 Tax=Pseudocercospora fijiensis (strain CIRAD86) TaxID=383855 RepID=M3BB51_PSEFD|nr:uncharacterized protein MYCFIDRAFT_202510 [Pseudocercospora fijiensis CIRAD86]EME86443.1 hypothetical protein MYCFIDRAFT_202510 [Pseudocercospora fijiensis CIRAD86]
MITITRLARQQDAEAVVQLSQRVQAALAASGSLQHLRAVKVEQISEEIGRHECFILEDQLTAQIIGAASTGAIQHDYYPVAVNFSLSNYCKPWIYLYSVMLDPNHQGRGLGRGFIGDYVKHLEEVFGGGTIILDCWAGNSKLRDFYIRSGFTFAAIVPENDYEVAVFYRELSNQFSGNRNASEDRQLLAYDVPSAPMISRIPFAA